MAKQFQVTSISFGKTEVKGKPCDQVIVVLKNLEKGTEKKEFIKKFDKVYSAAAVLNEGDICEAAWEKKEYNGKDYYNLVQLTRVGSGEVGSTPVKASTKPAYGGGYKEDPDKQTSIARQNVNNVAMQFVTKMLEQGIYPKKSTPDMLFEEIKRFSKKFEAYVTLKDDYSQMEGAASVTTPATDDGMLD